MNRFTLILLSIASLLGVAAVAPTTSPATRPTTQPTTVPTTAPATQPAHRTWYVTTRPAPIADGSILLPCSFDHAKSHAGPGDTVALHGTETFGRLGDWKVLGGVTLTSYGGTATIDGPPNLAALNFVWSTGPIEVANLRFTCSARDPSKPGFKLQQGERAIGFQSCNTATVWVHDCEISHYGVAGIDVEGTDQHGTRIERVFIHDDYNVDAAGKPARSQAIYGSGQIGGAILDSRFENDGWLPGLVPAINQNHDIYWHWDAKNPGGPLTCLHNTFKNSAAGGPTSNTGGVFQFNTLDHCSNDGTGIGGWASRDNSVWTDNTVIGCWLNVISVNATVRRNAFIDAPTLAVNIDKPAQTAANYRAGGTVVADNNLVIGDAPAVHVTDAAGGHLEIDPANNLTLHAHVSASLK